MLGSCAHFTPETKGIDKKVKPYVDLFIEESLKRGILVDRNDINIGMGENDEFAYEVRDNTMISVLGYCRPDRKTIRIKESHWTMISDVEREIIIFHELGHCVLFLDHFDDAIDIMNSRRMEPILYFQHRQDLLDRMIKRVRTSR